MNLTGAIEILKLHKHTTDKFKHSIGDKYVSDAINQKWIYGWIKKGFKNVKNPDLWKRMVPLIKAHQTTFHWVKGHAGHLENEICDELAVKAAQTEPLLIDEFFEHQQNGGLF